MNVIYSFVVDSAPVFLPQTRMFLASLMAQGVVPDQIHAHVTPGVGEEARNLLRRIGVCNHELQPFLDGKYCNKLVQLDSLLNLDADVYILCDTDLAFAGSIEKWIDLNYLRAKPVDFENPPLERLTALKNRLGLDVTPRLVATSCSAGTTWSTNCNGGLYIVPGKLAASLAQNWKYYATLLRECEDILENWYHHVDQIAFAMAALAIGEDLRELPLEANFPMHLEDHFRHMDFNEPVVLHYHWLLDETGRVQLTGHPSVDNAISKVNAALDAADPDTQSAVITG